MSVVSVEDLSRFCKEVLVAGGLQSEVAAKASRILVYADSSGVTTHGTNALIDMYLPRLLEGQILTSVGRTESSEGPLVRIDGQGGLGLVVAGEATELGVRTAAAHGLAVVSVRNSSHFGPAGFYAHRVAEAGMVGLVFSNCGNQGVVPPLGGRQRLVGSNPLAFGFPVEDLPNYVLDMSCTSVATGRIKAASRRGEELPRGWIETLQGESSTDPDAYLSGEANATWLGGTHSTGAAKGFGLALMIELLCGALAGAGAGPSSQSLQAPQPDDDIGHLIIVIDPRRFGGPQTLQRAREILESVLGADPLDLAVQPAYPGLREAHARERAEREGVNLPRWVSLSARELADRHRIAPLNTRESA